MPEKLSQSALHLPRSVMVIAIAILLVAVSTRLGLVSEGWNMIDRVIHKTSRSHVHEYELRADHGADVAMHVYRLLLEKRQQAIDYATLIEVHHPDYLDCADLRDLYSVDARTSLHPQQVEEMKSLGLSAA